MRNCFMNIGMLDPPIQEIHWCSKYRKCAILIQAKYRLTVQKYRLDTKAIHKYYCSKDKEKYR